MIRTLTITLLSKLIGGGDLGAYRVVRHSMVV